MNSFIIKRFLTPIVCLFLMGLVFTNGYANVNALNSPIMKVIDYHPDEIVTLRGTHFVTTSIEFEKCEKIVGAYIGDQIAWTYAIHPSMPNLLFLKPTLDSSNTNMTIITNHRVYHFQLLSNKNTEINYPAIYHLQFRYPIKKQAQKHTKIFSNPKQEFSQIIHSNYTLSGSKLLFPHSVYDDGKFTYFVFSSTSSFPAIFVDDNGHEKLINTQIKGNTLIAKCLANSFVLIENKDKAWVHNKNKEIVR